MIVLKLRRIGASTSIVLPKQMLAHLHVKAGQAILAIETPTGYRLTPVSARVQKQVKDGVRFLNRYSRVFSALAK